VIRAGVTKWRDVLSFRRHSKVQETRRSKSVKLSLDHVAIAVESIAGSRALYESLIGADGSPMEYVATQDVHVMFIGDGPGRIELLEPGSPDSKVARFLDRRGSGLHHLAYHVTDLEAELERLAAAGFELIDPTPRAAAGGHRAAFIHPRSTGGVLIELVGH
jgi:methylmalonyl-CoA/ethylmalonyl-CoA epimerase